MLRSWLFKTFTVLLTFFTLPAGAQDVDILASAKSYLNNKHQGFSELEGFDLIITDQTHNSKNGVTYVYFRQTYQGIEIINVNSNMAFKDGKIVHHGGKVLNKPLSGLNKTPSISAAEAIQKVASHLSLSLTEPLISETARTDKLNFQQFSTGGISLEPIPVKLVYWQNDNGYLQLAYDLSIYPKDQENWWSIRVDAQSGAILEKGDWVSKCQFETVPHDHTSSLKNQFDHHGKMILEASSNEQYYVYPYPVESPNHGEASLVVAPYDQTFSPYGWHDTNGLNGAEFTITRGNNVHAYEDQANTNEPGFSPNGGSSLNFDFPLDFELTPENYQSASITNLFYWNNIIHDIFSHYGFDEQSGNFQTRNYSGLGTGNDAVLAEDLDGAGTDNANFATPPEGEKPRMQMFLWQNGGIDLTINNSSVSGTYSGTGAQFGAQFFETINGDLVLVNDGSGLPIEGCGQLINSTDIAGKIAVVDRGNCTFVVKAQRAQTAGAIGLLVLNNVDGDPITMAGEDAGISIPLIMVDKATGIKIKENIAGGLNVTITDKRKFVTSSFDNGIITHEYGHGISTRLTGGASNSNCLGSVEQMGEGWSDYFGLILTMKDGDLGSKARGIGTYAVGQTTTGNGIRPAPYSTDFAVNSFTYADLSDENISQPHGIGFLWCTMIWDMTWLLIEKHGYDPDLYTGTGGNNIALQLVIDGLKLQPCNPGFIDGRDAILLADQLNNAGANQDIIWEAFARRGLGYSADQGSPNNRFDGIVAYDLPKALQISTSLSDVYVETGEVVTHEISVNNILSESQNNITVRTEIPEGLSIIENSITDGGQVEGSTISFSLNSLVGGETASFSFETEIVSQNGTKYQLLDDQENGTDNWSATSVSNSNVWSKTEANPNSGNKSWFVSDIDGISQQNLTLANNILATANTKLAFWHSYNTEFEYDGGAIEVTKNDGSTWIDLGSKIIENGYDTRLQSGSGNPLGGRKSFTGQSQGYIKTVVDLGAYEGLNIKVRFVFASDEGTGGDGWYIDDVLFFENEEALLITETCIEYDGQIEPICKSSSITILSNDPVCTVNAGNITAVTNPPLTVCNDGQSEFSVSNSSLSTDIQYRYFVTDVESPNTILLTSSSGTFDHTSLQAGNYQIWGFAYGNDNSDPDIDSFLASFTNTEEIMSFISSEEICASLTNTAANFVTTQLIKEECAPLGAISSEFNYLVHPNPSTGKFTLLFKNQNAQEIGLKVYNLQGQTMMNQSIAVTTQDFEKILDLSHLSKGLYILNLSIEGKEYQGRIVIE